MEIGTLSEKIRIIIGGLLGRADPVSKKVLTAFDPSKDPPANSRSLLKFSRNELEIFAEFLKVPITSQSNEKLFSNRNKLVKRILLEITSLYPVKCDECSHEYCVTSDKVPLVRCYICLQGSHDCEEMSARFENMQSGSSFPLGSVWLCNGCRVANNPYPSPSNPTATNTAPTTTTSTDVVTPVVPEEQATNGSETFQAELAAKLAVVKQQQVSDETKPNKCSTVCPKLAEGKCPHGVTGKTPSNGKDNCENYHPKRCRRFTSYASDKKFGCQKGDDCDYYHPQHCKSSLRNKTCFNKNCKLVHVIGTRRTKQQSNTGRNRVDSTHSGMDDTITRPRSTYKRDDISTERSRNTNSTARKNDSSDNHFLEIRSLLQGMQDKFQKEIEALKMDIVLQRSLMEHIQSNQPHPPPRPASPKQYYQPLQVPPTNFPSFDPYSHQRQYLPQAPSLNPMLLPQFQPTQVNWGPIPQASC